MTKHDWKKSLKHLYNPPAKPVEVHVPPMSFIMADGQGDPNTSADFQAVTAALYALSFTLKFESKQRGQDYAVYPLEGLWWVEGGGEVDPTTDDRTRWQWTLMVAQPDFITAAQVQAAHETVRRRKNLPLLERCRFEVYEEGLAAQIMHIGPYSAEKPTIDRLHAFIIGQGARLTAKHHEIYLGDPRRAAPEKLKTILRQPMRI